MALLDRSLILGFRLHDWASEWLVRNFFMVKRGLLIAAHLTLFGFFFPDWRRDFGSVAGNLLIVILFLSPLSKIFRTRLLQQLMGLRRELGIMFGYLATVHGLGYLTDPLVQPFLFEQIQSPTLSFVDRPLFFGFLGYFLTLPLLFTSNNLANRFLGGKNWKLLHRSVYVMALVIVFHRFFIRGVRPIDLIEMVTLIAGYLLVKMIAWRNFLPSLVSSINFVASRYQTYQASLTSPTTPPMTPPTPPVVPTTLT